MLCDFYFIFFYFFLIFYFIFYILLYLDIKNNRYIQIYNINNIFLCLSIFLIQYYSYKYFFTNLYIFYYHMI